MTWLFYARQEQSDALSQSLIAALGDDTQTELLGAAVFRVAPTGEEASVVVDVFDRDNSWPFEGFSESSSDDPLAQLRVTRNGDGPPQVRVVSQVGSDSDPQIQLRFLPERGVDVDAATRVPIHVPLSALEDEAAESPWLEVGIKVHDTDWGGLSPAFVGPARWIYGGRDLQRRAQRSGQKISYRVRYTEDSGDEVRQLQTDLRALGFKVVQVTGSFDRYTEWGVRAFQAYAKMARVAKETNGGAARHAAKLTAVDVDPAYRYRGQVSGVANAHTRSLLRHWKVNKWRCPVVVESWPNPQPSASDLQSRTTLPAGAHDNLWKCDDDTNGQHRMYVRDFSGHYEGAGDDWKILGRCISGWEAPNTGERFTGPVATPTLGSQCLEEAKFTPTNVFGETWADWDPAGQSAEEQDRRRRLRSNFLVIRSFGEHEFFGYTDCINAYDNAVVSFGPCHWTLAIGNATTRTGQGAARHIPYMAPAELPGFLAYVAWAHPELYRRYISWYGLGVNKSWEHNGVPNGSDPFNSKQAKYNYLCSAALVDEGGRLQRVSPDEREVNYFKSWHWFYRFAALGRISRDWRRLMFNAASLRVRDILMTPWTQGSSKRIGDVFTSELAVAIIVRLHVRSEGNTVIVSAPRGPGRPGRAGSFLRTTVMQEAGGVGWGGTPRSLDPYMLGDDEATDSWDDEKEAALIRGLIGAIDHDRVNDDGETVGPSRVQQRLKRAAETMRDRTYEFGGGQSAQLSRTRQSFRLYLGPGPSAVAAASPPRLDGLPPSPRDRS